MYKSASRPHLSLHTVICLAGVLYACIHWFDSVDDGKFDPALRIIILEKTHAKIPKIVIQSNLFIPFVSRHFFYSSFLPHVRPHITI
jgi:hypothetical protein